MENTTAKQAIMLYTEQTPNPESLKFVSNRIPVSYTHLDVYKRQGLIGA